MSEFIILWESGGGASTEITPTIGEVGAILRARTRNDAGAELGTFDTSTRPTADQVESYIAQAAVEVALNLPENVPEALTGYVRRLAALRAAMFVELSYFPEQLDNDRSAYDRLKEQFDAGMTALQDRLLDSGDATTRRVSSIDVVSSVLAPYPAEIRELLAPPWPVP